MRFFALHGIGEQEHKVGNDYVVNVRAEYDISKSALSDDLNDTLNYVEMYNVVKQVVGETQELLERVTYKIGERILERFEGTVRLISTPASSICFFSQHPSSSSFSGVRKTGCADRRPSARAVLPTDPPQRMET